MDCRRPSIISTSELAHPEPPRDVDDFGIDFSEMMALLWSRRRWIAAWCVIGAAQLAGFEARRDDLATLEVTDARNTLARDVSQLEVRQNQPQSEPTHAQQLRGRLSDNYLQSRMSARSGVRIDLIEEPPTAGVPTGPRTAGSMARGFALGLTGSVAVFLLCGRPIATRRRYPEMA